MRRVHSLSEVGFLVPQHTAMFSSKNVVENNISKFLRYLLLHRYRTSLAPPCPLRCPPPHHANSAERNHRTIAKRLSVTDPWRPLILSVVSLVTLAVLSPMSVQGFLHAPASLAGMGAESAASGLGMSFSELLSH